MNARLNTSSPENKVVSGIKLLPNGRGEMSGPNLSAPTYNFVSNLSSSIMPSTDLRGTSASTTPLVAVSQESHAITYVFVILGILLLTASIVSLVVYLVKRNKLDRIRHHLMPLYNFDPTDEEPHWEADLLEDDRDQQMVLNITSSTTQPKLKFHSHALDI